MKFGTNRLKTFVIIIRKEMMERTLMDANVANFPEYDIKAILSIDGVNKKAEEIYEYVENKDLEQYVLNNRIDEVLVAVEPKLMDKDVVSNRFSISN